MRLILAIYGIWVEVLAERPEAFPILENIGKDFDYFRQTILGELPRIRLELKWSELDSRTERPGPRLFKTKMCQVHGWGVRRFCDYGKGVWVKALNHPDCRGFSVFGKEADLVYEAAYLALLSSIGEELDSRGYHRLHAVGIQSGEFTVALAADSGQGKSATAALMGDAPNVRIFSDEMPLIREGRIHPFPIRMALHPQVAQSIGLDATSARQFKRKIYQTKALFEIPRMSVAQPAPLNFLLIGIPGHPPGTRLAHWTEKAKFLLSFVMGLGIPQMAEHMLRTGNVLRLARIAFSRLKTGLELVGWSRGKTQALAFALSRDPRETVREISKTLSTEGTLTSEARLPAR